MDNLSQEKPDFKTDSGPEKELPRLSRFRFKALAAILIIIAGSFGIAYLYGSGKLANLSLLGTTVKDCEPKVVNTDRTDLKNSIESYATGQGGKFHISLFELDTGASLAINDTELWDAASTAKIPILLTLYKKIETAEIAKDEALTITAADKASGTGYFIGIATGSKRTVAQTTEAMIKASDNTATNMILRRLGNGSFAKGRQQTQSYANSLGATGTVMAKNDISASDLALYLEKLYRHETTTPELSEEMLLLLTQDEKMDASFKSRLFAGLPEGTRLAHKIGSQTNAISDAGIVFLPDKNYVLVVAVINGGWIEADKKIAEVSRIVYEYEAVREAAGELDCKERVF